MKKKENRLYEILSHEEMKTVSGGHNSRVEKDSCTCSCLTAVGTWTNTQCNNFGDAFYAPDKCGGDGMAKCWDYK